MCWSLGCRSVHDVCVLIVLILTCNVILDTRNFPKESFHNSYTPSKSFMAEVFMFCNTRKKYNPVPEPLHDLCYSNWEPLALGHAVQRVRVGFICSDWHIYDADIELSTLMSLIITGEKQALVTWDSSQPYHAQLKQIRQLKSEKCHYHSLLQGTLVVTSWGIYFCSKVGQNPCPRALHLNR